MESLLLLCNRNASPIFLLSLVRLNTVDHQQLYGDFRLESARIGTPRSPVYVPFNEADLDQNYPDKKYLLEAYLIVLQIGVVPHHHAPNRSLV